MDVKNYCVTMEADLTDLKSRIHRIISQVDSVPEEKKSFFTGQMAELHSMVSKLDSKIEALKTSCPNDWSKERREIETGKKKLAEKIDYWDAEHIAGGYVGG